MRDTLLPLIRHGLEWLVYQVSWLVCLWLCRFYVRLRTSGVSAFPRRGAVLILSNHQSLLDPILIGLTSPLRPHYAARSSLFVFRPLGWYLTALGGIPLNREGVATSGIKDLLRVLKDGKAVVFYPEGTRTHDGQVQSFRKGVGLILRRAEPTVVLCGIVGAYDSWPRTRPLPGPGMVWVHYRRWKAPANWKDLPEDELTANLETAVRSTFEEARRHRDAYLRQVGGLIDSTKVGS